MYLTLSLDCKPYILWFFHSFLFSSKIPKKLLTNWDTATVLPILWILQKFIPIPPSTMDTERIQQLHQPLYHLTSNYEYHNPFCMHITGCTHMTLIITDHTKAPDTITSRFRKHSMRLRAYYQNTFKRLVMETNLNQTTATVKEYIVKKRILTL